MPARIKVARMLSGPEEWSRRRLQGLLAVAVVVMVAVLGGIVWSVVELVQARRGHSPREGRGRRGRGASLGSRLSRRRPAGHALERVHRSPPHPAAALPREGAGRHGVSEVDGGCPRAADRDRPPSDRVGIGRDGPRRDRCLGRPRGTDADDMVGRSRGPVAAGVRRPSRGRITRAGHPARTGHGPRRRTRSPRPSVSTSSSASPFEAESPPGSRWPTVSA